MVRLTDRPTMTIAVDLGRKATKQTNKQNISCSILSNLGLTNRLCTFSIRFEVMGNNFS